MIEQNRPLSKGTINELDTRLDNSIRRINRDARSFGNSAYFLNAKRSVPNTFRRAVGELVALGWPNPPAHPHQQDPFAHASEKGLIIGTKIAHEALSRGDYRRYIADQTIYLDGLAQTIDGSYLDLEDRLRLLGAKFVPKLAAAGPVLTKPRDSTQSSEVARADQIYANSLGFMFGGLVTALSTEALLRVQPPDRRARDYFNGMADHLHADTVELTTADTEDII